MSQVEPKKTASNRPLTSKVNITLPERAQEDNIKCILVYKFKLFELLLVIMQLLIVVALIIFTRRAILATHDLERKITEFVETFKYRNESDQMVLLSVSEPSTQMEIKA